MKTAKTLKSGVALFLVMLTLFLAACSSTTTDKTPDTPSLPEESVGVGSSSLLPTPSPSPVLPSESEKSPTPDVDPLEKKKNNTASSTEKDINVIPLGIYEFVLEDGRKLSFTDDGKITAVAATETKNTSFLVSFQNAGTDSAGRAGVRYVIYTGDSVKNSLYCQNNSVSVKESNDRLSNYNWYIDERDDNTVRIKHTASGNAKYLYINDQGEAVVGSASQAQGGVALTMKELDEDLPFRQYISEKGDIILRASSRIKVKDDRFQKLTNDMQVAYDTYYEMTGFLPYESIVIRIYQKEPYFGYVYGGWNVISFNVDNAITDLGKFHNRDKLEINDWNFCLLHEMGHMFDWNRGWRFHGEFATNMKVAYVLYANADVGASAATSGYPANKCFDGSTIVEMWNTCPQMTEATGFNLDRVLYLFVSYAQDIGWDNVKKAYQEIQAMPTQESNQVKRLDLFTNTMAKYAPDNKHVKDTFKEGEWEILLEEIS